MYKCQRESTSGKNNRCTLQLEASKNGPRCGERSEGCKRSRRIAKMSENKEHYANEESTDIEGRGPAGSRWENNG